MPFSKRNIGDVVLRHLAEIGTGRCSITDPMIAEEEDPETREILVGLLVLHEDLELERARRDEAIAARDEFISIASHELRTPLTSIRLQLELINQSLKPLPPSVTSRTESRLRVLKRQLERLESLVGELLDVSRITSGRLELHPERTDLRQLAFEVRERFEPEIVRREVTVSIHAPHAVVGHWDRHRLDQVLTNLLINALRYGDGKPVEITVGANQTHAKFSVRDQGIGMQASDQQRIFQPFARAVSSKHYGGLGLGLWIVRRILEAMGGDISVQSAPGKGALFAVEIPMFVEDHPRTDAPDFTVHVQ